MKYEEFEKIMSPARMFRYWQASGNNSRKAMTLYRYNLRLSQEMFTVISCFEIALRNAIDNHCCNQLGLNWLQDGASVNGIFDNGNCNLSKRNINDAILKLRNNYSHNKLVAELGFGFWRYLFATHQFTTMGRTLLRIFPSKPISSATMQYNQTYVYNQLAKINEIRNRIAHHEPICFMSRQTTIDTTNVRQNYHLILMFFQWMNIDYPSLIYGIDHINDICDKIDAL